MAEEAKKEKPWLFKKGKKKTGGSVKGQLTKRQVLLQEAVMMAAKGWGENKQGKDELVGFLRYVIKHDLGAFCVLLGKVMPLQIQAKSDHFVNVNVVYESLEDVQKEMDALGLTRERILQLAQLHDPDAPPAKRGNGKIIEHE